MAGGETSRGKQGKLKEHEIISLKHEIINLHHGNHAIIGPINMKSGPLT